ncbi:coiled-coil domain-containing protein 17-like isoform X4 [Rhinatrema bivittatum]|uniref:coiled-coil domain-containing protein 17-like isoform X4 n=1 Tax=Rhinatrema bivittatum TaxID=194408 RepID=UPI00112619C7|nr:coiled-coil domain-containing protein 17-like isoform X4 [Rhinatrema bivittatum]
MQLMGNASDFNNYGNIPFKKVRRIPKTKWEREQELHFRFLAEAHCKQLNDILNQNKHLEKQRDDIVQKLNELTFQSKHSAQLEIMLKKLNAQERRNHQLLESMKHQIELMQMESIALRLSYLQNGGNDQMILAHLQDLLTEAQQFEQQERCTRAPQKKRRGHETVKRDLNMELIAIQIENHHLEEEILKLQLKRQENVQVSRTSSKNIMWSSDLPMFVKNIPKYKIKTVNNEIDLLNKELETQRLRCHMKATGVQDTQAKPTYSMLPPVEEARPLTPTLTKYCVDSNDNLEPAPYDPISGFVVFFDFLLGLDPSYRVCCLVVGLYNNGQQMGSPFSLPLAYYERSSSSTFPENKRQNMVILAAKQAVTRVKPSSGIALVIELQASGGYNPYGQEVNQLVSRGWMKIDIFDYQNRVISGHWKIPVRILPMKPSLTTVELNGVPQVESAELYIRLVNARDADVQSTSPIEPNNAVFYKYPPLATACTIFPADVLHPSLYYFPYYQLMQPTHSLLIENVDPPPPSAVLMTH